MIGWIVAWYARDLFTSVEGWKILKHFLGLRNCMINLPGEGMSEWCIWYFFICYLVVLKTMTFKNSYVELKRTAAKVVWSCKDMYDFFCYRKLYIWYFLSTMFYILLEHFELVSSIMFFVVSMNAQLVKFLVLYQLGLLVSLLDPPLVS